MRRWGAGIALTLAVFGCEGGGDPTSPAEVRSSPAPKAWGLHTACQKAANGGAGAGGRRNYGELARLADDIVEGGNALVRAVFGPMAREAARVAERGPDAAPGDVYDRASRHVRRACDDVGVFAVIF